ncbi:hypothetical protein E4631_10010 [Hymenobacter sp. UV11]|uniref:hypothetical protein n=1 Tax=Hymenobacter sp. UV11 TaxID=1849735 RepID=UPI00105F28F2|nr:hypothetical protein [Hymenobacter sp. UV11]TDN36845.1 hypothetical protein A8B98_06720 [Hymenobacter sp. UV11]TFZ66350.1 hypothetical protein E4631_10010 [Hymenobacter sp. UV11]
MPSDNLDDLFRQQLGQHATPPGADLQRRLAELAEAERLDNLFRTGLGSHASQPRRELWERLEDEHLHPEPRRRRGVVAWWQLSAAAMLLLALLAGGLWRGGYLGQRPALAVSKPAVRPAAGSSAVAVATSAGAAATTASGQLISNSLPTNTIAQSENKVQEKSTSQATASRLAPSSIPIATTTRPRRPATVPHAASSIQAKTRRPDAAAGVLATTGKRTIPAGQPQPPTPPEAPELPASRQLPALIAMMAPPDIIEVDVRRGPAPARPAAQAVVATAPSPAADQPRRRLRLGGLLRQADHLVHGEPVSLAEATGLPESLTVQARLGGRTVSRTIQL